MKWDTEVSPVEISKKALEYAAQQHHDVILIDTAGRLHINEELMQELQDIKTAVRPQEILLVGRCNDRAGRSYGCGKL